MPEVAPTEGVSVVVEEARLTLEDLRLEGPPSTAWRWGGVAHAHPGHDPAGDVQGELLGSFEVDLLQGEELGTAQLAEGTYLTAHLSLRGPARLRGEALVDGTKVPFDFALALDQDVAGLPFEVEIAAGAPPSVLTLTADLQQVLFFLDWRSDRGPDGAYTVEDEGPTNSVVFGLASTGSWALSLEE